MKVFVKLYFFLFFLLLFAFNFTVYARVSRKKQSSLRHRELVQPFSKTFHKIVDEKISQNRDFYIWECKPNFPFTELILSWNAIRPELGGMTFWINVKHQFWSGWQRLAEWSSTSQKSFVNKLNRYVHTKHVRVEMQRGFLGREFKVKVAFQHGMDPGNLKALFVCLSNFRKFKGYVYCSNLPSVFIRGVPRQSQMVLNHPRCKDMCSPTSTGIIVNYFLKRIYGHYSRDLSGYVVDFAEKVYDNGYLDIYGNWILNVAQAYDSTCGSVFFRVERLNSFFDLHRYLTQKIPIAVSVRRLAGGATSYSNGHLIVVVGWSRETQTVFCIDPAFSRNSQTPKAYKLRNFLKAWNRSMHLSYVPIPYNRFWSLI